MTTDIYGPQTAHVEAFIDSLRNVTDDEWKEARNAACDAAYDAAYDTAWSALYDAARSAACDAAYDAAWNAAYYAAWDALRDAILAIVVRDRITADHYDILVAPMRLTSAVIPNWKED